MAQEKGLTSRQVHSLLEQSGAETLPPRNILNPDEFLARYYDGRGCFLPITTIHSLGKDLVCDFTTISDHHTFIANGFVTHNCGIVKNLAVTAQVTYGKPDLPILAIIGELDGSLFSETPSSDFDTALLVNGKFLGWCQGQATSDYFVDLRRRGVIYRDTSIVYDRISSLYIHTDTSRLIRPLGIVAPIKQPDGSIEYESVIQAKGLMGADIKTLFDEGAIEYVDSWEAEYIMLASSLDAIQERRDLKRQYLTDLRQLEAERARLLVANAESERLNSVNVQIAYLNKSLEELNNKRPFTHVELDPSAILGIAASIIPYPNHNQGPRNTYQCLKHDTLVWMADGSEKKISEVEIGEEVWCFDTSTMSYSPTRVVNQFVKATDKKVYEIETFSGRKITATYDHKFWTWQGWKEVQHLDPKQDKLAVATKTSKSYGQVETTLFVPIKSITLVENCLIADITTESENHNFVANGFGVHNSSMGKQALGMIRARHASCHSEKFKTLMYPTRPLFEPQINEILGMNAYTQGEMVWVMFGTTTGNTQEDAFIFNKASIDRGKFRMFKFINYRVVLKKDEVLGIPKDISGEERRRVYEHVGENGLPFIGAHIRERQAVVGKIVYKKGREKSDSLILGFGEEGVVDDVTVTQNKAELIVLVKMRLMRIPTEGDKFAPRNAQKGTIGLILPEEDMPRTAEGIVPDIIVNPHSMPSRMTHSYMMEIIASLAGAIKGRRIDATAFRKFNYEEFKQILRNYGYADDGKHIMYSGTTGKAFVARMYSGPCYFQALRHHVRDKIQARRTGPLAAGTRTATKGRKNLGGVRFGELERDTGLAHGASAFTRERLCGLADCYKTVFCCCGLFASRDLGGAYSCKRCGAAAQFGETEFTYTFKVLMNLVAGLGFKQVIEFETKEERQNRIQEGGNLFEQFTRLDELRGPEEGVPEELMEPETTSSTYDSRVFFKQFQEDV
jgi:DNA-directed RNA polymerase beta subunit